MKYSRRLMGYAIAPAIVGMTMLGSGVASAHGFGGFGSMVSHLSDDELATRQQEMFDQQAKILGITVSEVKDAWAAGKSFSDIISEKNLDKTAIEQRMKDLADSQMKSHLQSLVTKGVITAQQADSRFAAMQKRMVNKGKGHRGMMRGVRGFDF